VNDQGSMEGMMKRKNDLLYSLMVVTILALLLSSCDFSKVRVGEVRMMYGTNEEGHISYNYSTFTGVENGSFQVEAGQQLSFTYHVTVTKGNLLIEWQDPAGEVVWQKSLSESELGEAVIPTGTSGTYQIIIQGKSAGGDFDVTWEVDEA
jgi:hypothetical protein